MCYTRDLPAMLLGLGLLAPRVAPAQGSWTHHPPGPVAGKPSERMPYAGEEAGPSEFSPDDSLDETGYREALDPHGHWEMHPGYGWVWVPRASVVGPGWRPYTRGHWVYTANGWTWNSDFSWGWAPFHYGRWALSGSRWVWIPGSEWAPAWVAWRTHAEVVGWAPLPPGVVVGASVHMDEPYWVFVPTLHFGAVGLGAYYVPRHRVRHYYRYSSPVIMVHHHGHRVWYHGPRRVWVQRRWARPVHRGRYVPRRGRWRPTPRSGRRSIQPAPHRRRRPRRYSPPSRRRAPARRRAPPPRRGSRRRRRRI